MLFCEKNFLGTSESKRSRRTAKDLKDLSQRRAGP
jgi:hypothetical protein